MRARPLAVIACAVALSFAALPSARAQSSSPAEIAIARQTAGEGLGAYKANKYDEAIRLFEQARAVYPSAQILRMLGYSHLAVEHWEKAVEALEASLASTTGPLTPEDRKDVEDQLAKAVSHYGVVVVTTQVEGAELVVDGGAAVKLPLEKPLRLLPGKHAFIVKATAHLDAAKEIDVPAGKTDLDLEPELKDKPVAFVAPPPPPPPPSRKEWIPHQRTIGFIAAGTGVALGGAALVTALVGAHIRSNVASDAATHDSFYGSSCTGANARLCQFDASVTNNEADRADAFRNASVILAIPAGVLAAGGVVLILTAPRAEQVDHPATGKTVGCGPFGMGLACSGTF